MVVLLGTGLCIRHFLLHLAFHSRLLDNDFFYLVTRFHDLLALFNSQPALFFVFVELYGDLGLCFGFLHAHLVSLSIHIDELKS